MQRKFELGFKSGNLITILCDRVKLTTGVLGGRSKIDFVNCPVFIRIDFEELEYIIEIL